MNSFTDLKLAVPEYASDEVTCTAPDVKNSFSNVVIPSNEIKSTINDPANTAKVDKGRSIDTGPQTITERVDCAGDMNMVAKASGGLLADCFDAVRQLTEDISGGIQAPANLAQKPTAVVDAQPEDNIKYTKAAEAEMNYALKSPSPSMMA